MVEIILKIGTSIGAKSFFIRTISKLNSSYYDEV